MWNELLIIEVLLLSRVACSHAVILEVPSQFERSGFAETGYIFKTLLPFQEMGFQTA